MLIALCISLLINGLLVWRALLYFSKTTWESQRRQAEMERLLSAHQLAANSNGQPPIGVFQRAMEAASAERAIEAQRANSVVGHTKNGDLVRVPLAAPEMLNEMSVYDEDEDLTQ